MRQRLQVVASAHLTHTVDGVLQATGDLHFITNCLNENLQTILKQSVDCDLCYLTVGQFIISAQRFQ